MTSHTSQTANPPIDLNKQNDLYNPEIVRKIMALPFGMRLKLLSPDISQKIQAIGQKYGFELLRLANITRLIREYYFGEVRFEDFASEIEKRVGVSLLTAQEITRYIKSEIIDWDPWAEYVEKLPKMSVREMFEKKLKIADTEITAGYVELRGSDELEEPTIKNWIKDYITHLGYGQHSQMDRTQYIFHSENGKNLSSQDREKLGIILKSFDENIPLPVDEENGEIIFNEQRSTNNDQQGFVINNSKPTIPAKTQPTPVKQESFIKPYNPTSAPQRQVPRPTPQPLRPTVQAAPTQNFTRPNIADQQQPLTQTPPLAKIPYKATTSDPEIDKYFNTPEVPDIPSIKIHSMTEHNELKPMPQVLPPRQASAPRPIIQQPLPQPTEQRPIQPPVDSRPQHRIIEPFSERFGEPRIDGNIVDLSMNNDQ